MEEMNLPWEKTRMGKKGIPARLKCAVGLVPLFCSWNEILKSMITDDHWQMV